MWSDDLTFQVVLNVFMPISVIWVVMLSDYQSLINEAHILEHPETRKNERIR